MFRYNDRPRGEYIEKFYAIKKALEAEGFHSVTVNDKVAKEMGMFAMEDIRQVNDPYEFAKLQNGAIKPQYPKDFLRLKVIFSRDDSFDKVIPEHATLELLNSVNESLYREENIPLEKILIKISSEVKRKLNSNKANSYKKAHKI